MLAGWLGFSTWHSLSTLALLAALLLAPGPATDLAGGHVEAAARQPATGASDWSGAFAATRPPRVGIQAGHWKTADLPDELARLRSSTGTAGGGKAEWEVNLDIAERVVALLRAQDIEAEVLPSTVPEGYKADAFVALHCDGDVSGLLSGFKLARARMSAIPEIDDALQAAIEEEYQAVTGLGIDTGVSRAMTGYYAFGARRFKHSTALTTPAVILEMGFLTNYRDRWLLLGDPGTVAAGISRGVLLFLTGTAG